MTPYIGTRELIQWRGVRSVRYILCWLLCSASWLRWDLKCIICRLVCCVWAAWPAQYSLLSFFTKYNCFFMRMTTIRIWAATDTHPPPSSHTLNSMYCTTWPTWLPMLGSRSCWHIWPRYFIFLVQWNHIVQCSMIFPGGYFTDRQSLISSDLNLQWYWLSYWK